MTISLKESNPEISEKEIFEAVKKCRSGEHECAKIVYDKYSRLISFIASKFEYSDKDDLFQEGATALLNVIYSDNLDLDKCPNGLGAYIYSFIYGRMWEFNRMSMTKVHIPRYVITDSNAIIDAVQKYVMENGIDEVPIDFVVRKTGLSEERVENSLYANQITYCSPESENGSIIDFYHSYNDKESNSDSYDHLNRIFSKVLTDREKDILTKRFLSKEKTTLRDIAGEYNLTPEGIRQIEIRALRKLKAGLERYLNE